MTNHVTTQSTLVFDDTQYRETTLSHLNTLRKGGRFCDVILSVGGHNIPAHRAMLACASIYLFELFDTEEECDQHYVQLENVDYDSFEILVNYVYTSKLEVPADMVKSVYRTATWLKMNKAAEACSRFLADNLAPANCLGIRAFANSHSDSDLTTRTDSYIQANLDEVLQCPERCQLPNIQMKIIGVTEDDQTETSMRHLCGMVVDWLQDTAEDNPLGDLCEQPHMLYLTADKNLRDCLEIDDHQVNGLDMMKDYRKLNRYKQVFDRGGAGLVSSAGCPLTADVHRLQTPSNITCVAVALFPGPERVWMPTKGKDKTSSTSSLSSTTSTSSSPPQQGCLSGHNDKQLVPQREWKLIATSQWGEKNCVCVAMLDDSLAIISLTFLPYPLRPNCNGHSNGVIEDEEETLVPVNLLTERLCSLIPLDHMSSARCGFGTAVIDDIMIVLGGYDRGECLQTVESYDLQLNKWMPLQLMLSPRGRFDATVIDDKVYACGGSNGSQDLMSAECYDPATDQWSALPDMQISRCSTGVAGLGGRLYVIGGWSGFNGVTSCEVFDPATATWSFIADLHSGRSQITVCVLQGKLVAVGGCDAWDCTNSVEVYDPEEDKWSYLPPMANCRRGAGAAVFREKLYVIGGSDGHMSLNSVEVFDPSTQTWSFGPSLSVARTNVGVAVMQNRLFAVGGFSGKAFLDSVEHLAEDGCEWCSSLPVVECCNGHA
ncbi:influenza virus NS1A binding protein [Lamellibrachia satsuma]|nr:influenza virus NS1A binding protein [Lamellibrachia satsuma]